jgi:signal peptidase I
MIDWLKNIFQKDVLMDQERIDFKSFLFLKKTFQSRKLKIKAFGISMWPLIKKGQVIEIEVLSSIQIRNKIKKDSIIAFYCSPDEKIIIHRVIELKKKKKNVAFLTKGDNVNKRDLILILPSNVLGLVKI